LLTLPGAARRRPTSRLDAINEIRQKLGLSTLKMEQYKWKQFRQNAGFEPEQNTRFAPDKSAKSMAFMVHAAAPHCPRQSIGSKWHPAMRLNPSESVTISRLKASSAQRHSNSGSLVSARVLARSGRQVARHFTRTTWCWPVDVAASNSGKFGQRMSSTAPNPPPTRVCDSMPAQLLAVPTNGNCESIGGADLIHQKGAFR
jgi:hypothetical protein